jgi:hypothetical protein
MNTFKLFSYIKVLALLVAIYSSAFARSETLDFIILSDIHLNASAEEKMLINPSRERESNKHEGQGSDLDATTFDYLLTNPAIGIIHEISANLPTAKFAIILGDTTLHTNSNSDRAKNLEIALKQLKENLPLPLLYVMGNNDSPAGRNGYFVTKNKALAAAASWQNVFLSTGLMCPNVFPCLDQEYSGEGEGYFSAYLASRLKFIGMNSVFFRKKGAIEEITPKELSWFEQQLKNSAKKNESVLIGMHIPLGQWSNQKLKEFGKVIKKYPKTVIGILASHTHLENLAALIIQDKKQNRLIPIIHTASLSTRDGNAPSFKNFVLTQNTTGNWAIKDFTTYHFIQKDPGDKIQLKKYYSFENAYCPNEDTSVAECMIKHIPRFNKTETFAFNRSFENRATQQSNLGNPNLPGTKTVTEILVIK